MTEIKKLRWRLSKFFLDHVEASANRVSESRIGAWFGRQAAVRSFFCRIDSKVVRPAVGSVSRSVSTLRRREVLPWVFTWLVCACLGLIMCMPMSTVGITLGVVATLAFFIISLRSPYSGLLLWLATAPILDILIYSRAAEGLPLITWSRICIIPLVIAFLFGDKEKQQKGPDRVLGRILVLFIMVMIFVALRGENPKTTCQIALDIYIIPVLGYVFARRWVTDDHKLTKLLILFVFIGAYYAALGIPEHFLGHTLFTPAESVEADLGTVRIQGPSNSVTECGMVLLAAIFISITCLATNRNKTSKVIYTALICLFIVGVALTLRRSIYIGLVLGLSTMLFASKPVRRVVLSILLIGVIVAVLQWGTFSESKVFTKRIADSSPVYSRLASYVNAWGVFTHNPWIGVGLGNYAKYREKYQTYNPSVPMSYGRGAGVPHNQFLTMMVEGGVLGLISFVLLLIIITYMCSYLGRITSGEGITKRDGVILYWAFSAAYFVQFVQGEGMTYGKHVSTVWFVLLGAFVGAHMQNRDTTSVPANAEVSSMRRYDLRKKELV